MNQLDLATALNAEGRFADALSALDDASPDPISRSATLLLKAELSERVGRFGQSLACLDQLRGVKRMTPQQQSSCEFIVGKIEWEEGKTESAVAHLQRAVALATQAGDLVRKCWPQMWLLASISDRSGPDSVATLLAELRSDAVKLGEPQVLAGIRFIRWSNGGQKGALKERSVARSSRATSISRSTESLDRRHAGDNKRQYRGDAIRLRSRLAIGASSHRVSQTLGWRCKPKDLPCKPWLRCLLHWRI